MFAIATLLKGVGAATGILGQFGAARAHRTTARTNQAIAHGNAQMQYGLDLAGVDLSRARSFEELQNAELNLRLSMAESEAMDRNADRLRGFAEMQTAQGRTRVRRMRRSFDELEGRQLRAIASAGVTASGSALDVMADSAGQAAIALADAWDETTFAAAETVDRASMTEFGAAQSRIAATGSAMAARRAHDLNMAGAEIAKLSAGARLRSALFGGDMALAQGMDSARGATLAGIGGIFAGAGGMIAARAQNRHLGL
jgi:hypothetical protein